MYIDLSIYRSSNCDQFKLSLHIHNVSYNDKISTSKIMDEFQKYYDSLPISDVASVFDEHYYLSRDEHNFIFMLPQQSGGVLGDQDTETVSFPFRKAYLKVEKILNMDIQETVLDSVGLSWIDGWRYRSNTDNYVFIVHVLDAGYHQ